MITIPLIKKPLKWLTLSVLLIKSSIIQSNQNLKAKSVFCVVQPKITKNSHPHLTTGCPRMFHFRNIYLGHPVDSCGFFMKVLYIWTDLKWFVWQSMRSDSSLSLTNSDVEACENEESKNDFLEVVQVQMIIMAKQCFIRFPISRRMLITNWVLS